MTKKQIVVAKFDAPPCLRCGRKLDAHSGNGVPADGDVSVCFYCFKVSFFEWAADALRLREAETAEDLAIIAEVQKEYELPP